MKQRPSKGNRFVRKVNVFRQAIVTTQYIVCAACGATRYSEPDQDNTAFAIELAQGGWRSVDHKPVCSSCKKGKEDE